MGRDFWTIQAFLGLLGTVPKLSESLSLVIVVESHDHSVGYRNRVSVVETGVHHLVQFT